MIKIIETMLSKINFIVLFGLCLGFSSRLYGSEENEISDDDSSSSDSSLTSSSHSSEEESSTSFSDSEEDDQTNQNVQTNDSNKEVGSKDWNCSSIKSCKAVLSIIGTLKFWQDKINKTEDDIDSIKDIFSYLSSLNNYRDIISGYHHILDVHLNGKNNKKGWKYINDLIKKQGIKCVFKNCKGYDRNQRDREREKQDKKEQDLDLEYIFIRDTLDTIHSYLVHGGDSGHRYYKKEEAKKPYKIHKRPADDVSDDEKEEAKNNNYTLFDKEMRALKEWQKEIQQKGRNQKKSKFLTDMKNDVDDEMSFELLSKKFGSNKSFGLWLKYLKKNECDTDVLLNEEEVDVVYDEYKGDKEIVDKIYLFIKQKEKGQKANNNVGQYGFGKRLYYWEYYKDREETDAECNDGTPYSALYVSGRYLSFKNEILSKGVELSKWNDITYKAEMVKKQSDTLKEIKAVGYQLDTTYGIEGGSGLTLPHIQSVMFYTNLTSFCTEFGASFRFLSNEEDLEELKKRNSHWFWLSKYLREVVECYGTMIDGWDGNKQHDIKGDTYFHGVSYLLFTEFSVNWFGPLSTSKQMEVATLFTTEHQSGIILDLKQDDQFLRFFNVCLISCFGSEDERLFIGGHQPIQIASIRLLNDDINLKQIMHSLFIINSIIRGKAGYDDKALQSDFTIFLDLLKNTPNTFPVYVEKIWKKFVDKREKIEINMYNMHDCYSSFCGFFISSKVKNLLEFHKITKTFKNCKQIISQQTDYDGGSKNYGHGYILGQSYIPGLLNSVCLINADKWNKLKKIKIGRAHV